jgi:hypothetical protein
MSSKVRGFYGTVILSGATCWWTRGEEYRIRGGRRPTAGNQPGPEWAGSDVRHVRTPPRVHFYCTVLIAGGTNVGVYGRAVFWLPPVVYEARPYPSECGSSSCLIHPAATVRSLGTLDEPRFARRLLIRAEGRFWLSARGVKILNSHSVSSGETGVRSRIKSLRAHLISSAERQEDIGGLWFSNKWRSATLQSDLNFVTLNETSSCAFFGLSVRFSAVIEIFLNRK